MSFWELFEVAAMPILQVILISALGALMATGYLNNLLSADTRRSLNKIVFMVFTPSLVFSTLAKTVTIEDIISWWFMPINIGIIFLLGSILGWIILKILKPSPQLEGLVIATCSSGSLGNLLIIIVSATCDQNSTIFGSRNLCRSVGLSYASFSMAFGTIYVWIHTFQLVKYSSLKFKENQAADEESERPNTDFNDDILNQLLKQEEERRNDAIAVTETPKYIQETRNEIIVLRDSFKQLEKKEDESLWHKIIGFLRQTMEELFAPPTVGVVLGFVFGATKWLRNLVVGKTAPLRVIQDSVNLLGEGTIPCTTLLLGGNLTQGLRSSKVKPKLILSIIFAKYIILPSIGIFVVKLAQEVGLLPADPLFPYVLMVQYALPPAMSISTMTQLFEVGREECSVLMLWTYVAAAITLTAWSTVFMWILSP